MKENEQTEVEDKKMQKKSKRKNRDQERKYCAFWTAAEPFYKYTIWKQKTKNRKQEHNPYNKDGLIYGLLATNITGHQCSAFNDSACGVFFLSHLRDSQVMSSKISHSQSQKTSQQSRDTSIWGCCAIGNSLLVGQRVITLLSFPAVSHSHTQILYQPNPRISLSTQTYL